MQHKAFNDKRILVLDKVSKKQNDRTWCFWEKQNGLFEPVVHHKWQQVHFFSDQFSSLLNLSPYQYKMIRGIDFYEHVLRAATKHSNITFQYGNVENIGNDSDKAFVVLNGTRYTADYVFNSILFNQTSVPANKIYLLQHFKGYIIETDEAVFDPLQATLMDFRVNQNNGTTFAYVLPVANNRALVEYTLFTAQLLNHNEYDVALHNYITSYLGINNYRIIEREFGVIPMTNMKFAGKTGRVINIGTAGGQTKASSGYTFQFIQKQSEQLVQDLLQYSAPKEHRSLIEKRFKFYDTTLLNILHKNRLPGHKIFADLFQKNPTDRVLRFLDNESSLKDELRLMGTLPQVIFMKAALEEILK
jgi:lycopene beta-cyclase